MNRLAYDYDGSGRPIYRETPDPLRAELESLPDFIHEAMGETSGADLARALADDDAIALMRLVRKAVRDYADFYLRHSPDSEDVTLRRLVRVYRGQVAA